jgi:colanic acid biosynthesis glycosyl transferase WcaI
MRLLLVSPFFYPEAISTGRYNTVLAEELVRSGAEVDVIASHPLYPTWRPARSGEQLPGMRIFRGGAWMRYPRQQVVRRIALELWFFLHVAWRLVRRRSLTDRVVQVFPPNLFALAVSWLLPRRVQRVGIVHDIYGVMARPRWVRRAVAWMERRAFRSCETLVFLSFSMADWAVENYGIERSRIRVHYPFLSLPPQGIVRGGLAKELPEGFIHVVYSGALGDKQEPDRLVELMRELARHDSRIRCHVFSAGPHFERLKGEASANGDSAVAFRGLVPEEALPELYWRSTVQILPQAKGTGHGALPSKLPNLIAAGVPVFAICDADSEVAVLLRQLGQDAGFFVDGFDAPDLLDCFDECVRTICAQPRHERILRYEPAVRRLFHVQPLVKTIIGEQVQAISDS